jgi:gamma-glutamyltranspeptidase / glutathione hydrolase
VRIRTNPYESVRIRANISPKDSNFNPVNIRPQQNYPNMYSSRIPLMLTILILLVCSNALAQVGFVKSFDNAAVVSATQEASDAGIEIMRMGGNAIDAAVAVKFALAVTFPAAGNIGGGGFMVIRSADGNISTLDFREMAPAAAHRDMYLDENGEVIDRLSTFGHLASGVPGTVDGMIRALERYGTLPLATVMEPAIRLARDGFPLSWREARSLNNSRGRFSQFEGSTMYFVRADNEPWREGDLFVQSDLAATLQRIADRGRDGFYAGETADLFVAEMQRNGGIITHEDLANYRSVWREPLQVNYRGYTVHLMGPPSSGGIAIGQMLTKLEPYNLRRLGYNTPETVHLMAEVSRRVYADRAEYLGDPDFYEVPSAALLDPAYNRSRMQTFNPGRASASSEVSHGRLLSFQESEQTTHFSVIDRNGTAVSLTTTINSGYGSFVSVTGAGFLLNNEMDDFSIKPGVPNQFGLVGGEANAVEPGKRMLSSMTPTIVTRDGELKMLLGTPGGSTIMTTVLQVLVNIVDFGMNVQQAVAAPRFHHQWLPDMLYHEPFTFNRHTAERLEWFGHTLNQRRFYTGQANCIVIGDDGSIETGADPRGMNHASGF